MIKEEKKKIRNVIIKNDEMPKHIIHWIPLNCLEEIERLMEKEFFQRKNEELEDEYLQEVNWLFKKHCENGKFLHISFKLTELEKEEDE